MKLLIIPTLNEKKNISKLYNGIKKNNILLDILFIDDNSSDGTRSEIIKLKSKDKKLIIFSDQKRWELVQRIKMV